MFTGIFSVKNMFGQDALRTSVAGEQAEEALAKANATVGYYNLKMGDLQLRLQSGLSIEADDNVNLVNSDKQGDVIISPSVNAHLTYPISEKNSLNFNIGIGYSAYVVHQNLDQLFITPGTELSFNIFVKDFVINLHDRLSITEQSYENPEASGVANYSYLENDAGISATWDLNKAQISVDYDHVNLVSFNSAVSQEDSTEELFSANAGLDVNNFSELGVEISAGIIKYDQNILNGGVQYSAGLFYKLQLSQYISLRADAGYFIDQLDNNSTSTTNFQSNVDAFYGSLSLEHRINEHVTYTLQGGRQIQSGLFSDTLDLYYAQLQANWSVVRQWPFTTYFSYENGTETGGLGEKIERYGFGASVSRAITRKLDASLAYSFWDRLSNLPGRDYTDNQIVLTLTYNF